MSLQDLNIHKPEDVFNVHAIIYGLSGVGKTSFCAIPGKTLILDTEGGIASVRGRDIDVISIKKVADLRKIFDTLVQSKEQASYEYIVLDSATELQQMVMADIINRAMRDNPTRDTFPTLNDWGKLSDSMRRIFRAFKNLPYHTIVTCLEQEVRDESTGILYKRPELSGKLSGAACAMVDIVGRLASDAQGSRHLLLQPKESYVAKNRFAELTSLEDILVKHDDTFDSVIVKRILETQG